MQTNRHWAKQHKVSQYERKLQFELQKNIKQTSTYELNSQTWVHYLIVLGTIKYPNNLVKHEKVEVIEIHFQITTGVEGTHQSNERIWYLRDEQTASWRYIQSENGYRS